MPPLAPPNGYNPYQNPLQYFADATRRSTMNQYIVMSNFKLSYRIVSSPGYPWSAEHSRKMIRS